jgi:hypothetical protein
LADRDAPGGDGVNNSAPASPASPATPDSPAPPAAPVGPARATARRASELLPLALALVAEACWVSAIAGLAQLLARREPVIGVAEMALLVAVGALAGRATARRLGGGWPVLAAGLVAVAAVVGVLFSAESRALLATAGLDGAADALGANPGGLLAGLALLRGTAYAAPGLSEERLERLLSGGTLAIIGVAIIGGFAPDPWRQQFITYTLVTGLAFAAAGIVALALHRQALEGRDRGADWQRNPRWVALLVLAVTAIAALAASSADLVRPALEVLISLAVVPIIVLGLIFGWTRRGVLLGMGFAIVAGVVVLLIRLFGSTTDPIEREPLVPDGSQAGTLELEPSVVAFGGGLVIVLAVVAAYLLVRLWARYRGREPDDPTEQRFIDRPPASPRKPRRRPWFGRRQAPRDAVEAYRALLTELEQREVVRREAWETPHEHARRLRAVGAAGLSLELLAADYALVTFAGMTLTEREQRRALARWRSLRRSIHPPPLSELPELAE